MFVILWIKENKYYAYTKENHWTDNIEAAGRFNTLEAAQKYAKNGLKDKLHELQYLTLDGKEVSEDPIPTLTKEEAEAAYEELRQAVEIFGKAAEKIPAITKYYATIQSEQDKLGRMLKACRIKRREAKDRLGYMIAIGDAKGKNILAAHNNILIDLDHASEGGDYIKLLDWLEAKNIVDTGYSFHLHSMNPVGVQNMRAIIEKNGWREI